MFHALGVGAGDVVSFMLPLLPQSFRDAVRRRGRRHRQSRQPAARAAPDRRDPGGRATPRCWSRSGRCRAPTSGQKVEQIRRSCKQLKAIVQVVGGGDPAQRHLRLRRPDQAAAGATGLSAAARSWPATSPPISTPAAPPARRSWCGTPTPTRSTRPGRCNLLLQVEARRATCCSACRCSMSAER